MEIFHQKIFLIINAFPKWKGVGGGIHSPDMKWDPIVGLKSNLDFCRGIIVLIIFYHLSILIGQEDESPDIVVLSLNCFAIDNSYASFFPKKNVFFCIFSISGIQVGEYFSISWN